VSSVDKGVAVLQLKFFAALRGKRKLPLPFSASLRGPSKTQNTNNLNFDDSGFEKE